jgi:hypothetical protein
MHQANEELGALFMDVVVQELTPCFCYLFVNRGDSMVSFFLNNERADFHRPHPAKEAKPYQVRCAREFLNLAGVKP